MINPGFNKRIKLESHFLHDEYPTGTEADGVCYALCVKQFYACQYE